NVAAAETPAAPAQSSPPAANPELQKELDEAKTRAAELEKELAASHDAQRANSDKHEQLLDKKNQELELAHKEIDELKQKLASGAAAGTAREFLDLREQLNRKDKEILEIRDRLISREKEVVDLNDKNIALEREKADLTDRENELKRVK